MSAEELAALKAKGIKSVASPGDDPEAKVVKHSPVIALEGKKATVTLPHPQAEDHVIQNIWIEDAAGTVLASRTLAWTDATTSEFEVPEGTASVIAYAFCNLHGVYASPETTIACRKRSQHGAS